MARLGCRCGATMGTSMCPSPYSIFIYYDSEVRQAIVDDPDITLMDFLTDWDEKHECQKEFMHRPEPVEYWYCIECRRIYEVQAHVGGRWLRVYRRSTDLIPMSFEGWPRIYVMTDMETYAATEMDIKTKLSDYLAQHDAVQYLLSPDESIVCAIAGETGKILYSYVLEDAWLPESE